MRARLVHDWCMQPPEILETCLYGRDLDPLRHFYSEVLGLKLVQQETGRHLFFRCGARMLLVFNPEITRDPGGDLPAHGCPGPVHIAFGVRPNELNSWRERLQRHSVAIEKEMTWPGGGRSFYFRDPAGNSVEIATSSIWNIPESEFNPDPL